MAGEIIFASHIFWSRFFSHLKLVSKASQTSFLQRGKVYLGRAASLMCLKIKRFVESEEDPPSGESARNWYSERDWK
jgi:hypothetical protein